MLDLRQLNRATLARQCLLERVHADVPTVVDQVGGLQAQAPAPPFIGLWSRIADFDRSEALEAIASGTLVRGTTMRGTIHLHTADQYRALRQTLQPLLDSYVATVRRRIRDEDFEPALAYGRRMLAARSHTGTELRTALAERFPDSDARALTNAVRLSDPLLHVPDLASRSGWKNVAPLIRAEEVVGELATGGQHELIVRTCLSAMGPGTVKDIQAWSGVTRLQPVVRELLDTGELIECCTHEGVTIYDLPDAPRPGDDVVAPPRYLPMWDNLLLSHADRARVIAPEHKPYLASKNGMLPQTFLVDGFVHGTWTHHVKSGTATLQLAPFLAIPRSAQDGLVHEGEVLLRFLEPEAQSQVVRLG